MLRDLWVFVFDSNSGIAISNAYFGTTSTGGTSYNYGGGWYLVRVSTNGSFWADAGGYGQMWAWAGTFGSVQVALPPVAWPNS
jgi:hypothetical protein